ncbi:hypothetical protein NDN08_007213 [Rhodosorus marinus]|uniref:C2H2-type domain-containing protein n=1 Tax=Rhodosorus marinus TaxID=101924 RepID=A0AAV8UJ38_9RHOD|nr:hypothetical protein NDN08_007213 [Rhodosorus marinus]
MSWIMYEGDDGLLRDTCIDRGGTSLESMRDWLWLDSARVFESADESRGSAQAPLSAGSSSGPGPTSSGSASTEAPMRRKKKFPCRYCDKEFTQSGHRNEHECRFHLKVGYWCPTCDGIFGAKSKLDRHVRSVHSTARNHKCECGKDFKDKCSLTRHMKVHRQGGDGDQS